MRRPTTTIRLRPALFTLITACSGREIILGLGGSSSTAVRDPVAADSGAAEAAGAGGTRSSISTGEELAAGTGTHASPAASAAGVSGAVGGSSGTQVTMNAAVGGVGAGAAAPQRVERPSAGCGKQPNLSDQSVSVYGSRATYLVDLPASYDKSRAYPLVLAFRDSDSTAEQFRDMLQLGSITGTDAILVHANCLNDAAAWEFTRDMPMFDVLLPKLKDNFCIDEDRVLAVGAGAGSLFVNLIGCVNADNVRAIAPLTGAPVPPGPCAGNTALWMMQSKSDPASLGAGRNNRDFWAGHNGCDAAPTSSTCFDYTGCDEDHPVYYCEHDGDALPSVALPQLWSFFQHL